MSNTILIKNGSGKPEGILLNSELGFDKTNKNLYIGTESGPQLIGGQGKKDAPINLGIITDRTPDEVLDQALEGDYIFIDYSGIEYHVSTYNKSGGTSKSFDQIYWSSEEGFSSVYYRSGKRKEDGAIEFEDWQTLNSHFSVEYREQIGRSEKEKLQARKNIGAVGYKDLGYINLEPEEILDSLTEQGEYTFEDYYPRRYYAIVYHDEPDDLECHQIYWGGVNGDMTFKYRSGLLYEDGSCDWWHWTDIVNGYKDLGYIDKVPEEAMDTILKDGRYRFRDADGREVVAVVERPNDYFIGQSFWDAYDDGYESVYHRAGHSSNGGKTWEFTDWYCYATVSDLEKTESELLTRIEKLEEIGDSNNIITTNESTMDIDLFNYTLPKGSSIVPCIFMMDYDESTKTTLLSGTYISKVKFLVNAAGSFTFGTVDLNTIGSIPVYTQSKTITVSSTGMVTFPLEISVPKNQTLAFHSSTDTGELAYYVEPNQSSTLQFWIANSFKNNTPENSMLYGTIYGISHSSGVEIAIDSALSDISTNPVQNKVITNEINEITNIATQAQSTANSASGQASTASSKATQALNAANSAASTANSAANAANSAYDLAKKALPLSGGTMTGTIDFGEVSNPIDFGISGWIRGKTSSGGRFDIFGYSDPQTLQVGGSYPKLELKGSAAKPTYNGIEIPLTTVGNTFDGEQKFKNSQYCPTVNDTAPNVGCAFKASRGLFNQAIIDEIIMSSKTNSISFKIYSGTTDGQPNNLTEIAKLAAGALILKPPAGEGGQIQLEAARNDLTNNGIVIDTANGDFRIFGLPSSDGTSRTGFGSVLQIDPYEATIVGPYSIDISGNIKCGSIDSNYIRANNSVYAPAFISDGSQAAMRISDGNEISFNTRDEHLYFGYANRLNSEGLASVYHFGTHSGADGADKGTIKCGNIFENGQELSQKYAPKYTYGTESLIPGSSPLEEGHLYIVYE